MSLFSRWLCSFVVFGLAACADDRAPWAASPTHPGWIVLQANDSLRWEIDTSGLAWHAGRATLWIGVVSVSDEREAKIAPPFQRFETRQDVNCMMRIARGLQVRTPDTNGSLYISPVRDTSWFLFQDHPLGGVLMELCGAMRQP